MTYTPGTWTCDVCCRPVSEREMITLVVDAGPEAKSEYETGWLGHYHAPCWLLLSEQVETLACPAPADPSDPAALAQIPTADLREIGRLRGQHRLPDGTPIVDREQDVEPALNDVLARLGYRCRYVLPRAGVRTLEQVARMTDAQLLAIEGVGAKTVRVLREAIAERENVEQSA